MTGKESAGLDVESREIYAVMKAYSDSLDEVGDDPNFTSFDAEDDDFKGLLRVLAAHFNDKLGAALAVVEAAKAERCPNVGVDCHICNALATYDRLTTPSSSVSGER